MNRQPSSTAAGSLALPCALLFGAMLNLTLVVAGLKELVVDELGGTVTDAALFFTVEMIAYLLFGPVWGVASDRLGRRRPFVVGGFAVAGLLYLAFLTAHSIQMLLVLRFFQGAAAIAGWSTVMAMLFDRDGETGRPRRAGIAGAALMLGIGTGAPLGGLLAHLAGPRAPLAVAGGFFLLLAIAALWLPESATVEGRPTLAAIRRQLAASPSLLVPSAFYLIERFTIGLFVIVFPLHLERELGADPALRGRYLALFLFPFAAGQLATYRLSRRLGPVGTLLTGTLLYGSAFAVVGLLPVAALAGWMVVLGALAAVIFPPTLALTAAGSRPETRASAFAALNLAGSLGFALGPIVGAQVAGLAGFPAAFALAGGLAVAGALAVALLARPTLRELGSRAAPGPDTSGAGP